MPESRIYTPNRNWPIIRKASSPNEQRDWFDEKLTEINSIDQDVQDTVDATLAAQGTADTAQTTADSAATAAGQAQSDADLALSLIEDQTLAKGYEKSSDAGDDPSIDVDGEGETPDTTGFKLGSTLAGSAQHSTPGVYAAFKILNTINPGSNAYATIAWNSTHYFVRTGDALEKHDKFSGEQVGSYTGLGSAYQVNTVCNEGYVAISSDNGVIIFNAADMTKRFEVDTSTTNDSYMALSDAQLFYTQAGTVRIFNLSSTSDYNATTQDASFTPSPTANGPMAVNDDYIYMSYSNVVYCFENAAGYADVTDVSLSAALWMCVDSDGGLYVQNNTYIAKYSAALAAQLFNVDTGMNSSGVNPDYMQSDGLKIWRTVFDQDGSGYCYNYQLALNVLLNDNEGGAVTTNTPGQTAWAVDGETETASPEEIRATTVKAASNELATATNAAAIAAKDLQDVVDADGEVDIDSTTKIVKFNDAIKDNGDYDKLSFIDFAEKNSVAYDGRSASTLAVCNDYIFVIHSADGIVKIDKKTGRIVASGSASSGTPLVCAKNGDVVQLQSTITRVYSPETLGYTDITQSNGTVREAFTHPVSGRIYAPTEGDVLNILNPYTYAIEQSFSISDIDYQNAACAVDDTEEYLYLFDAPFVSGNGKLKQISIATGEVIAESSNISTANAVYASLGWHRGELVLVHDNGSSATTMLLTSFDTDLTLVRTSSTTVVGTQSEIDKGAVWLIAPLTSTFTLKECGIPSLTAEKPDRTTLKHIEYTTESGATKTGEDFSRAVTKSDVAAQIPMGVSVESVEATPVAASIETNESWPVSDQDGLTIIVSDDTGELGTITFDSTFPSGAGTGETQRNFVAELLNGIDGIVAWADNSVDFEVKMRTSEGGSNKTLAITGTNTITWATATAGTGAPSDVVDAWYLIEDSGEPTDGQVTQYTVDGFVWYSFYEGAEVRNKDNDNIKKVCHGSAWYDETHGQYADDSAATAGGVAVGEVYIDATSFFLRTRMT